MIRSLGRKWWALRNLPRTEQLGLMKMLFFLPFVAVSLRFLGLARLRRIAARKNYLTGSEVDGEGIQKARNTARIVRLAASAGFFRTTCLDRSVALWWQLNRIGIPSQLRIGVRKDGRPFEAHAWVACQGIVLNDREEVGRDFAAFETDIMATR